MLPLALSVAVMLGGSADALVKTQANGLSLRTPAAWTRTEEQGTRRWVAPSKDAEFSLDVFPWEGEPVSPEVCRDKLVAALGGEGWEPIKVGGAPAAVRTVDDTLDDGKQSEVQTRSVVGCNGKTKWAVTFVFTQKKKARFAGLADEIVKSLRYDGK